MALTTLATLLLELSLTRIFSVVFHYHFAFLAISIALFGLGAGGVFSYLVADWRGDLFSKLGALAAINSLVVLVSLILSLSIRQNLGFWTLAAVYFPSTLPFFLSGTVVSLAIAESHRTRGPRVLLRLDRSGRRMPAAGAAAEHLRRPQHRARHGGFLCGVGRHLVQPGGKSVRAAWPAWRWPSAC